ncbi:hypothetical protein GIHI108528_01555 [Gillisia hiemivivida]
MYVLLMKTIYKCIIIYVNIKLTYATKFFIEELLSKFFEIGLIQ